MNEKARGLARFLASTKSFVRPLRVGIRYRRTPREVITAFLPGVPGRKDSKGAMLPWARRTSRQGS